MINSNNTIKHSLIISFDIIRPTDPSTPLAVGYLMAFLKNKSDYNTRFTVQAHSCNINALSESTPKLNFSQEFAKYNLPLFDTIALGAYVWGDSYINPSIQFLRSSGFRGKIVLGGYQITYSTPEELKTLYPGADIFISGYAEEALYQSIISEKSSQPVVLSVNSEIVSIPSPYLTKEINVSNKMPMVRMITKRGCLYKCHYCAHKDLLGRKVHDQNFQNALLELELFRKHNVQRINVLYPVFNYGKTYLPFLRKYKELDFTDTQITLQTRIEIIRGEDVMVQRKTEKSKNNICEKN